MPPSCCPRTSRRINHNDGHITTFGGHPLSCAAGLAALPILRELGSGASALSLVGIYIAACFLAPLVEETVFRGALYGHLRRRHRPILCAIAVSLLFAAIHPEMCLITHLLKHPVVRVD